MRQTIRLLNAKGIAAVLLCTELAGCAIPHNNTLVFAVNRKMGVDITPVNTTSPGLTIGYSSTEFAWVPLWANGPDGKPIAECTSSITSNCSTRPKFIGKDAEGKGNGRDEDAYSVFASFGGNAAGNVGTETKAELRVASFFATGIAAQNLAEADPAKLVGADIRSTGSNSSDALHKGIKTYFDATAKSGNVQEKCIDALKLDSAKFSTLGKDLDNRSVSLVTNFVTKAILEKAPDQAPGVKYQAELLLLKYKDEKSKAAAPTPPKTADDVAREAVCK